MRQDAASTFIPEISCVLECAGPACAFAFVFKIGLGQIPISPTYFPCAERQSASRACALQGGGAFRTRRTEIEGRVTSHPNVWTTYFAMTDMALVPKFHLGTPLSAKLYFATAWYAAGFDTRPATRGNDGSGTSRERPFPSTTLERGDVWEREEEGVRAAPLHPPSLTRPPLRRGICSGAGAPPPSKGDLFRR